MLFFSPVYKSMLGVLYNVLFSTGTESSVLFEWC